MKLTMQERVENYLLQQNWFGLERGEDEFFYEACKDTLRLVAAILVSQGRLKRENFPKVLIEIREEVPQNTLDAYAENLLLGVKNLPEKTRMTVLTSLENLVG